ncbi:hypothetical protein SAMN04489844_1682 [Nocardioides exalbidus]|uniref:DUF3592 domain-containing protein n=1 Tax=Nocardioides exalbidus TaxID=402596 RepID=A0A1H4PSL6_9ACTN|nr:hypothetical protein [Nocardioides exalbidus]SEC10281.1 hypothetical protein SAMN04489844_1682 [Nocardioides exalbidus]
MAADRPVPDRPVPDRPSEGFSSEGAKDSYGMTWVALALLVLMIAICSWRLYDFWDSRQAPAGAQEATVLGFEELGRSRPGDGSPEYASIHFQLADGSDASAIYQLRRLGEAEKGDTITVYESGGEWRTTSEKAWGSTLGWGIGLVLLLVMVVGWFRVRSRVKRGRSPF